MTTQKIEGLYLLLSESDQLAFLAANLIAKGTPERECWGQQRGDRPHPPFSWRSIIVKEPEQPAQAAFNVVKVAGVENEFTRGVGL
ncbi:MAG: hypothetical protein QF573_02080 [Chloroflexota bacterium]|nr:hypothetical protein [Chloroflexota bacterium]